MIADSFPQYEKITECSNGLLIVGQKIKPSQPSLKYGVIDTSGNTVLPMDFISIYEEIGRYFRVRRLKDSCTAMLDLEGNVVVDYDQYAFWWSFFGDYIKVKRGGLYYGLLDRDLQVALPCDYRGIFACSQKPHINCYGIEEIDEYDEWDPVKQICVREQHKSYYYLDNISLKKRP